MSSAVYVKERIKMYAEQLGFNASKLANAFGVDPNVMLLPIADKHRNDEDIKPVVDAFKYAFPRMSDKEKKVVSIMIDVQDR